MFVHGALCMSVSGQCYMSAFLGGRIGKFFRDTVSEMKKVVWPSKKQIINNTVVVAVVVVVAAVLIMVLDAVFGFGLNQLLKGV